MLAIIYALQTWRPYSRGAKFTIFTDHHTLKYLDEQKTLSRKQARWVEFKQEFDYTLKYIKGKSNIVADALSRNNKEVNRTSSNVVRQLKYDYESDPFLKEQFKDPKQPYMKIGNRLYFEKRLCIPNGSQREMVLHDNH